jgi:hypothetical protein
MSEQTGSQTVDTQHAEDKSKAIQDARSAFGIPIPSETQNEPEEPVESFSDMEEQDDPPAKEDDQKDQPQKFRIKVKYKKQDVEVDEDQLPELVQKGLALDKERERKSEYQKALDRAARLQGFKDHKEFLANLDRIEAEAKKKEESEFKQLREELRQQAEDAGIDPNMLEQFIENHPLMREAKRIKAESEERAREEQERRQREEMERQWAELYESYPDLMEDAQAFTRGETPSFYTQQMQDLIAKGYHPLHAYQLAHLDKITSRVKEQTRQAEIKKQIYNKRSQVETQVNDDLEPEIPENVASAFAAFGLDPRRAKKYLKQKS